MYEIILSPTAKKDLEKLNKGDRERVTSVLQRIRVRPFVFVKRLVGVKYFSLRVGKHRVILDIRKGELVILVIEIGHRKNIYKKL